MTGRVSTPEVDGFDPWWLHLREEADAAARAGELLDPLRRLLAGASRLVIHDLGCGTGAMGRWLAGRLPGPQHWILHDHDPALLAHAVARMPAAAADGSPVTVTTRRGDLAELGAAELTDASLVTASALLDLLTREEVARLAAACVQVGCPALLTLSVDGRVRFTPADPRDGAVGAAFNDHQRRPVGGRRLLGPDAAATAAAAFTDLGATVRVRPSPWRLGPEQAALASEWLRGWIAAAYDQRPELADADYRDDRLRAAAAGALRVVVGHQDVLAHHTEPPDPSGP